MASDTKANPALAFDPKDMEFRQLGKSGVKVSVLSFGLWLTAGNTVKGDSAKDLVKTAWELGINFFDTAENYANGAAEIELGQAIKELGLKRSELVVSTKVFGGTGRKDPNGKGLSRKHIIEGLKDSLERLQLDYVDVVFAHRPDPSVPMEEVVRAFTYLINSGKAFYWGTSEWSAVELEEAYHAASKYGLIAPSVEQPEYSLFNRKKVEGDYLPIFKRYGLGTTIWSPLASGLLTGKYNDGIPTGSRYDTNKQSPLFQKWTQELQSEVGQAKIAKVRKLKDVADRLGAKEAQLALAWAARNTNVSTVILGATRPDQLKENVESLQFVKKLTPEVLKEIDDIFQNNPQATS